METRLSDFSERQLWMLQELVIKDSVENDYVINEFENKFEYTALSENRIYLERISKRSDLAQVQTKLRETLMRLKRVELIASN